jgi:hypothetical protein
MSSAILNDDIFQSIVLQVAKDDGWKLESTKGNLQIQRKSIFPDKVQAVRVIASVPLKPKHVFQVVLNIENRLHISDHTKEAKFVYRDHEHNTDIIYTCVAAPSRLVSNRDFVVGRRWATLQECGLEGEGYIVAMKSVTRDDCPPKGDNVRGEFIMQALMVKKKDENSSEIRILNQVELNGWIPSAIQSYFQTTVPCEMPELLEKGVKYEKEIGHITD